MADPTRPEPIPLTQLDRPAATRSASSAVTPAPAPLPTPPSITVRAHYPAKADLKKITATITVHQPGVIHTKDFDIVKNGDGSITVAGTMAAATQSVLSGLAGILDHLDANGSVSDIWT